MITEKPQDHPSQSPKGPSRHLNVEGADSPAVLCAQELSRVVHSSHGALSASQYRML